MNLFSFYCYDWNVHSVLIGKYMFITYCMLKAVVLNKHVYLHLHQNSLLLFSFAPNFNLQSFYISPAKIDQFCFKTRPLFAAVFFIFILFLGHCNYPAVIQKATKKEIPLLCPPFSTDSILRRQFRVAKTFASISAYRHHLPSSNIYILSWLRRRLLYK